MLATNRHVEPQKDSQIRQFHRDRLRSNLANEAICHTFVAPEFAVVVRAVPGTQCVALAGRRDVSCREATLHIDLHQGNAPNRNSIGLAGLFHVLAVATPQDHFANLADQRLSKNLGTSERALLRGLVTDTTIP